jgi:L-aspartate oxidase
VHGANRLASNSLLEGMVFGFRVVEALDRGKGTPDATGAMRSLLGPDQQPGAIGGRLPTGWTAPAWTASDDDDARVGTVGAVADVDATAAARAELQRSMTTGAGVLRSVASLAGTAATVSTLADGLDTEHDDRTVWEARNLIDLARGVLTAATERHESRGAHTRTDFEAADDRYRLRLVLADPA